jgi:hypothetical protein
MPAPNADRGRLRANTADPMTPNATTGARAMRTIRRPAALLFVSLLLAPGLATAAQGTEAWSRDTKG